MISDSTVYIALGSNLGDRSGNLIAALEGMQPEVTPVECSPVYETEPWGYREQPAFLNQVVMAKTQLPPLGLLTHLKNLELRLGRQPTFTYGPRLIDIDIIFYNDLVLDTADLTLPHPRLPGRAFVLVPLADLAPEMRHPVSGITVMEMLAQTDTAGVRKISPGGCDQDKNLARVEK